MPGAFPLFLAWHLPERLDNPPSARSVERSNVNLVQRGRQAKMKRPADVISYRRKPPPSD